MLTGPNPTETTYAAVVLYHYSYPDDSHARRARARLRRPIAYTHGINERPVARAVELNYRVYKLPVFLYPRNDGWRAGTERTVPSLLYPSVMAGWWARPQGPMCVCVLCRRRCN